MNWIYFSPHIDDAALSCGGLIYQQSQAGETVQIWTICAGDPPAGPLTPFAELLHTRWKLGREAAAQRRLEDLDSCARLCAFPRHFPLPDCIYRRSELDGSPLYPSEESIFAHLHPEEESQISELAARLALQLPAEAQLVSPLALGNHVDHQLTRRALERLGRPLWYYPDYPYAEKEGSVLAELAQTGWRGQEFPLSPAALEAWGDAILAHRSQVSTFWEDEAAMRQALEAYAETQGGVRLWRAPGKKRPGEIKS
jgi:LmbE family N-acetylglucosaminyl deacetylase